jgi:Polyketide cyclase / dehydrase and lipid transport
MSGTRVTEDGMLWLLGEADGPRPAGPGPRGARFEHRLLVNAPAQAVWATLSEVDGWGRWSTLYPSARGSIEQGSVIDLRMRVPGAPLLRARATVIESIPNDRLSFLTVASIGLKGFRYFLIEPAETPDACIVCDGEVVSGISRAALPLLQTNLFLGLRRMNEGLKVAAENRVRMELG